MFLGKVEHLKGDSLMYAPVLPANIRQGWRGSPGANTLAYYEHLQIKGIKVL
jgi:hypothetical protein